MTPVNKQLIPELKNFSVLENNTPQATIKQFTLELGKSPKPPQTLTFCTLTLSMAKQCRMRYQLKLWSRDISLDILRK